MDLQVTQKTLDFLWASYIEAPRKSLLYKAEQIFGRALERDWCFYSDVEDMLIYIDDRLGSHLFQVSEICELFTLKWANVAYRPKRNASSAMLFEALRVEDVCVLLIYLERLGLEVDANRFVGRLLPRINNKGKQLVSNSELEIFYYPKERSKWAPISLFNDQDWFRMLPSQKKIVTTTGYKVSGHFTEGGQLVAIDVVTPKYRKRQDPYLVQCSQCGFEWYKGDPQSSANHRKEHRIRMTYLDPQPNADLINEGLINPLFEHVIANSPKWKHIEMYKRAGAFKREFQYDFYQWDHPDNKCSSKARGFLLSGENGEIVGACSFFDRTGENENRLWGLQWIWICPRERGKGHLSKRWEYFRETFGDFIVESPVSDAMQGFLRKVGDSQLMKMPSERI